MALGTAVLNVLLVGIVIAYFVPAWRARLVPGMRAYARTGIFLLALAALAGTLLMEFAGALPPCMLCWWQRVFMYPIVLISLIAVIKDTDVSDIADYILALSVCGAAVALYQHLLQMLPTGSLIPCDAAGECSIRSVFEFGFVTIPWMALSVFALFIFVSLVVRKR